MMERVSSLLPRVLNKRGLKKHADASLVLLHVHGWIKKNMSEYAPQLHPRYVKDGVLLISAENSIAAQELQVRKEVLLDELKEHGTKCVRELRIERS